MRFSNIPLARKLLIGFGAVLGLVAAVSVFTVVQVRQVAEIERLNSVSDDAVDGLDKVQGDLAGARSDVHKLLVTGASADNDSAQKNINKLKQDLASVKDILSKDGPQFLPDLADCQTKLDSYLEGRLGQELRLASDAGTRPEALTIVTSKENASYTAALNESLNALHDKVNTWSDGVTDAGNRAMNQITAVVTGTGVLCILVGLTMTWLITRAIGRPLQAMTQAMGKLAAGDHAVVVPALDQTDEVGRMAQTVQVFKDSAIEKVRLERETADVRQRSEAERASSAAEQAERAAELTQVVEGLAAGLERLSAGDLMFRVDRAFARDYEKLRSDFNGAMEKLRDTMKVVSSNTTAIRSGSNEISTAADDLSRRTEQQAASLEETAAALDEITATVRKTSEGAAHARAVVAQAKSGAEHSGAVMREAVKAMAEIEASARQISQIIGVIDEIAFQTNLLALNAGVEAARAGDAGRGFAVVASEVRALAQRSAEAAKEIKTLISASSRQVAEGVDLVDQTGKALDQIVVQVTEMTGIVGEIAASTQEQATALQQVNTAINQMDQVTQQNAAMVEESTAASHSLTQETEDLARIVGTFQVGPDGGSARVAAPAYRPTAGPSRPSAPALRTIGRGGAARKPEPAAQDEGWTEF